MASTTQIIKTLLEEQGCSYDDGVIEQLNEYAFRFMKIVVDNASKQVENQQRTNISTDDIKLAMDFLKNSQTKNEDLSNFAKKKNEKKLQERQQSDEKKVDNYGFQRCIKLPNKDVNLLFKPNYQLIVQIQQEGLLKRKMSQIEIEQQQKEEIEKPGRKKLQIDFSMADDLE